MTFIKIINDNDELNDLYIALFSTVEAIRLNLLKCESIHEFNKYKNKFIPILNDVKSEIYKSDVFFKWIKASNDTVEKFHYLSEYTKYIKTVLMNEMTK